MPRSEAPTRVEQLYGELRADILAGRLRPATRLQFTALSERYGASMGVAREALARLAAEGLVEAVPRHGFRVVPISATDLRHLTDARVAIESLVLRESLAHGGIEWESRVLAAHHRLARTPPSEPDDPERVSEQWAEAHRDYHAALLCGCPNPRLVAVAESLRAAAELYRRWSWPLGGQHRDVAGEHRSILEAVLAHDTEAAVAALTAHIEQTTRVLLEHEHD